MLQFDMVQSGLVIVALLCVGELISKKLKAILPAVLVAGVIYIALVWSGVLPKDMIERSGLTNIMSLCIMFVVLGMGSTTNFQQLAEHWKVVVLAAGAYLFELAMLFLVIGSIFGINTAVASMPGGSSVMLIVQEQAKALGYDDFVLLSVLLLSIQGLVACPIVSLLIRAEVKRIRETVPNMELTIQQKSEQKPEIKTETEYMAFLKLFIGAWIANRLSSVIGISQYVICLLLGVVFSQIGFFRHNQIVGTNSRGFLFLVLNTAILDGFTKAEPQALVRLFVPLCAVLVCDVISLTIAGLVLGKLLGFSRYMGVSIAFNIMLGFPLNMMISNDMVNAQVEDEKERAYLSEKISTQMIIGGFTSTTFLSVIMAGLLVGLMK